MTSEIKTWEALTYQWKVWKFFGLVPPQEGSIWRLPYIIITSVFNILLFLLFPLTLIVNCMQSKSVSEFCENGYMAVTVIVSNLKFLNSYFSLHNLLKVRPILKELDKRAKSEAEDQILLKGKNNARKCFMFYVRIFSVTHFTSNLIVFLAKERRLIYPAWFPWNWKDSFTYYAICYVYQLYAITAYAIIEAINVTYPSMHMCILSAHIEALATRIKNLGSKEAIYDNNSKKQEEKLYKELTECVKVHEIITKFFQITESTIAGSCLIQFMSTGLAQCTLGVFFLYNGLSNDVKLLNIVFFFMAVSFMTFDLCYYGTQLQEEYKNLSAAVYSCNWMDQSKKFKDSILILLHRTQEFNHINAYIVPIILPTFLKVMKFAYSGFTFLTNFK